MKKIVYNKLIRDKIPEIIKKPVIKTIENDNEFLQFLIEKLLEEVQEFKDNPSQDELADILEVTHAIVKAQKWSLRLIESVRKKKHIQRGGFSKKLFLISVNE
ncbi:MAG: phosphoribosyl-ATP pyrophosphohydrolase [Candidatus Heimdallarchaeota archaeon]